jgi:hypothetical protein
LQVGAADNVAGDAEQIYADVHGCLKDYGAYRPFIPEGAEQPE